MACVCSVTPPPWPLMLRVVSCFSVVQSRCVYVCKSALETVVALVQLRFQRISRLILIQAFVYFVPFVKPKTWHQVAKLFLFFFSELSLLHFTVCVEFNHSVFSCNERTTICLQVKQLQAFLQELKSMLKCSPAVHYLNFFKVISSFTLWWLCYLFLSIVKIIHKG